MIIVNMGGKSGIFQVIRGWVSNADAGCATAFQCRQLDNCNPSGTHSKYAIRSPLASSFSAYFLLLAFEMCDQLDVVQLCQTQTGSPMEVGLIQLVGS